MTDREKMILVVKQYYEELKPGFRGNPVEIANRLIAAGFGIVTTQTCSECGGGRYSPNDVISITSQRNFGVCENEFHALENKQ